MKKYLALVSISTTNVLALNGKPFIVRKGTNEEVLQQVCQELGLDSTKKTLEPFLKTENPDDFLIYITDEEIKQISKSNPSIQQISQQDHWGRKIPLSRQETEFLDCLWILLEKGRPAKYHPKQEGIQRKPLLDSHHRGAHGQSRTPAGVTPCQDGCAFHPPHKVGA